LTALSLAEMEQAGYPQADGGQLVVRVPTEWPADGEKRIGYVSIMRLVESARELHWRRDIAPVADLSRLDSITKSLTADFRRPVLADTEVCCSYEITWLRPRSYGLRVTLREEDGEILAQIELTSVFIDPGSMRPAVPGARVTAALRQRLAASA
jgi:acyl-CoA thioesterase FadM